MTGSNMKEIDWLIAAVKVIRNMGTRWVQSTESSATDCVPDLRSWEKVATTKGFAFLED